MSGGGKLGDRLRALTDDAETGQNTDIHVLAPGGAPPARVTAVIRHVNEAPKADHPFWLVSDDPSDWAALRGIRRVAANETGRDIRCALLAADDAAGTFAACIAASTAEEELFIGPDGPEAPRVVKAELPEVGGGDAERRVLTIGRRGALQSLGWEPSRRTAPGIGEIEIRVLASGLNFRDVMWAQGPLPAEALEGSFSGTGLGMECAGEVVRAGPEARFRPGDKVIAFARKALSSHVTVPSHNALALPAGADPIAAATIPVAFFTAEYALGELAALRPGEWVLIHGAAGGVGQAALQVALAAGAKVIGTAGTPQKRRLIKALGAAHACDSRSMDFEDEVLKFTEGAGADVVLNALSGEAMERSLACVAPFGRFVELGKRDFYANSRIGMRAFRRNVSYFGVDADQLLAHRPEVVRRVLERIVAGFRSETYGVLPYSLFPPEGVEDAFRAMQRSEHIGKILISPPDPIDPDRQDPVPIDGAWLVTGGTQGFGLEVAGWLAEQGARRLWLVSRTGSADEAGLKRIRAAGARVDCIACDVSDAAKVEDLCAQIAKSGGLDGVVHGAMVLDDAQLAAHDADRVARVLEPKVTGAEVLDRATRPLAPRHFWLFSSVAARFGNPGQAAYVAANLALEDLARHRVSSGLPALAIAWGPLSDAGVLANNPQARELIERQTGRLLTAREACDTLGRALASGYCQPTLTIAPMSWSALMPDLPVVRGPLFEMLGLDPHLPDAAEFDLPAWIAEHGAASAREKVLAILVAETARILCAPAEDVARNRPLAELGFDSLMGMNLKLAVEERLGQDFPIAAVAEGPSLDRMSLELVEAVGKARPQGAEVETARRHLTDVEIPDDMRDAVVAAIGPTGKRTA